jgi:dynein light intermediate chain
MATQLKASLLEYREPEASDGGAPKTKNMAGKKPNQIGEVLNAILPPRQFINEEGVNLVQKVSPNPSSREDVINLQMKLDERLQERQARENEICPVREELYSQCFDELIRQVCIECPERGLLLLRVRDEVRMTIAAYQTLYQSSITFGMRKTLQAEQGNSALVNRIEELTAEKERLQSLLQDQRGLLDSIEKRNAEQRAADEKGYQEERDFLEHQGQHLEKFIAETSKN